MTDIKNPPDKSAKTKTIATDKTANAQNKTSKPTEAKKPETSAANASAPKGYSLLSIILISATTSAAVMLGGVYWWDKVDYIAQRNIPTWEEKVSALKGDSATHSLYLDELETRITALENSPAPATQTNEIADSPDACNLEKWQNQLGDLQAQISMLKEQDSQQAISILEEKLRNTENTVLQQISIMEQTNALDFRLFVAFQQMQSRALSGRDFSAALETLKAIAVTDESLLGKLNALTPYAKAGRVDRLALQQNFRQNLKKAIQKKEVIDDSISGKLKQNLSSFITIRKLDSEGNTFNAAYTRAEKALDEGNITTAIAELEKLPEEKKAEFENWLNQARSYIAIPDLLLDVEMAIAGKLSPSDEGTL